MTDDSQNNDSKSALIGEHPNVGLVVDRTDPKDSANQEFNQEIEKTLAETAKAATQETKKNLTAREVQSWEKARRVVADFKPTPWFIWRLSNYVLGKPGQISKFSEGLVYGLRRLIFAAASDEVLGENRKVNTVREALLVVEPDVIAAAAVIHAFCRKLSTKPQARVWKPILDDALLRAQIGFFVAERNKTFGCGRGMLAGFSGRSGLCTLIAIGTEEQAQHALEKMAAGADLCQVGYDIYECDPLHVSGMLLVAAGCGRDAAFGIGSFSAQDALISSDARSPEQVRWLAAIAASEQIRQDRLDPAAPEKSGDPKIWQIFEYDDERSRTDLLGYARTLMRRGHGWTWLTGAT